MHALNPKDQRRSKRVEISIPSRLRHGHFKLAHVEIRNLSFHGFRAEACLPLSPGDYVSIDLPNIGLVRARIAWSREGRFGAVFPTAVDVRKCFPAPAPAAAEA